MPTIDHRCNRGEEEELMASQFRSRRQVVDLNIRMSVDVYAKIRTAGHEIQEDSTPSGHTIEYRYTWDDQYNTVLY
jgi:hypothetical protein